MNEELEKALSDVEANAALFTERMKSWNQSVQWPQGPGWSPDGGAFWIRGDFIYWNDGDVRDLRLGHGPGRMMPGGVAHGEDYSAWSEEHRAKVKQEWAEKRAAWKKEAEEAEARRQVHLASARAKLTDEEWDAVIEEGRD